MLRTLIKSWILYKKKKKEKWNELHVLFNNFTNWKVTGKKKTASAFEFGRQTALI